MLTRNQIREQMEMSIEDWSLWIARRNMTELKLEKDLNLLKKNAGVNLSSGDIVYDLFIDVLEEIKSLKDEIGSLAEEILGQKK